MRKTLLIFLSVFIILISCLFIFSRRDVKDPNEIIDKLKDLKSYSCDVYIDVKNDKQNLKYEGKQYYFKGVGSRLELEEGRIFVFKDNNIYVKDSVNNLRYVTIQRPDDIFKISFIDEYLGLLYTNEAIEYSYKTKDDKEDLLIKIKVPGNNRNLKKLNLYINEVSGLPEKIIIYDIKGNEKIQIRYENFVANDKIEKELFNTDYFSH